MKKLFDELSSQVSKATTQKYSTSFSLGILALHHSIRPAIYAIYGYVRLADEIVDSFHSFNKAELLQSFKEQTWSAIDQGISLNPILHSFQQAIKEYNIERKLIDQFLHSMEMDLQKIEYNSELYREYILGSAEVVGLMCLHVFVNGNKSMYEELKPYAMKLGSAFQKVNFLRDLNQDYLQLGRTYFPDLDLNHFTNENKLRIEKEIEAEFQEALLGIQKLPGSSKFGVFLAYSYYRSLFEKIRGLSAEKILNKRIRIPNSHKLSLMMSSYIKYKLAFV
jgi:15-cis-phytoene synthase